MKNKRGWNLNNIRVSGVASNDAFNRRYVDEINRRLRERRKGKKKGDYNEILNTSIINGEHSATLDIYC